MQQYRLMVIIIVMAGAIISCTRNSSETASLQLDGSTLPGVWELRGSSGGMLPYNPDNYKPGNGDIWKFTGDHFERIYRDSVYNSGSYTVANNGVDLNTNRTINQFIFNGEPAESFELKNDTLHIYYGLIAADGVISHFVKISNGDNNTK